ncbi:diphosphomevalonate decarboxylase [Pelolinea submarina]|uniref:diphosphomevalonate decarboxylase n=1 Tax=Pelolinea submarina TaxID=913107 RepID=A0A347ZU13_9CHLR|nr:diphosphomevalonate decarboxylase [Pelolinea submarina]REG10621.1 diphosphomevalonate decarboxylase [Pelolinea submarina]BBB48794.1 diphosphomevalonate decarboxylase [Pelolinea submarina]
MIYALAHPNIAFIKYWGNRNQQLRLPMNGSISMNLSALETHTAVSLASDISTDQLWINNGEQSGSALARVSAFLDIIREMSGRLTFAEVRSTSNFPASAGIASSAAAFAALAIAGAQAYGLDLNEKDLSCLARRGSGSACRSIPTGFTEWRPGSDDNNSYAQSIAAPDHWPLWDCIAVVESGPKPTGSTEGHALAPTSPLQAARVADTPRRLDICRQAIQNKDFEKLADIIELDSNIMHAVMMTSQPALMYWSPASLLVMKEVRALRQSGLAAAFTLDAGPNVHVITTEEHHETIKEHLSALPGVQQVISSPVGGAAKLIEGEINNL